MYCIATQKTQRQPLCNLLTQNNNVQPAHFAKSRGNKLACKDPNKNKLACAELGIATTN
nr:MAG TPA: hypothetical protein [Caudoviricetes sp.]